MVVNHKKKNIAAMENGIAEDTIILLPTVPWMQEIVKSIVAVKLDGGISFKTYIDKYYATNGFDLDPNREKPNADDVVKKIMEFEKKIFGTEEYKISDKRLFKYISIATANYESFVYKMAAMMMAQGDGGECLIYTEWISEDGGVTWTEGESWESPSCFPDNPIIGGGGGSGVGTWVNETDPGSDWGGGSGNGDTTNTPVDCLPWYKVREVNGDYDYSTPAPCLDPPPPVVIDLVPNPCDQADSLAKHISLKKLMDTLKTKASNPSELSEHAFFYKNITSDSASVQSYTGDAGTAGIDLTISSPIDGFFHNHYAGLLSVFSPDDLWSMATFYTTNKMVDFRKFTLFVSTASGTNYLLKIEDSVKFKRFALDITSTDLNLYKIVYSTVLRITPANSTDNNEVAFLKYILKLNGGSGLKLFKGNDSFSEWTPLGLDRDGNVATVPCL